MTFAQYFIVRCDTNLEVLWASANTADSYGVCMVNNTHISFEQYVSWKQSK